MFALKKNFLKKIRENPFIEFSFFILVSNISIYWLSPGTRPRYVYMLYPFIIIILTYFYMQYAPIDRKKFRFFQLLSGLLIALLPILFFSLPFIPQLEVVPNVVLISIISGILAVLLFTLFVKIPQQRLFFVILGAILFRFVFNFTIFPIRATTSKAQIRKNVAYDIVEITRNEPLYMFGESSRFSNAVTFYITRERGKVLTRKDTMNTYDFFIAKKGVLKNKQYKVFYTYTDKKNREFVLIKFTN